MNDESLKTIHNLVETCIWLANVMEKDSNIWLAIRNMDTVDDKK